LQSLEGPIAGLRADPAQPPLAESTGGIPGCTGRRASPVTILVSCREAPAAQPSEFIEVAFWHAACFASRVVLSPR
jgi:hypothetical protein